MGAEPIECTYVGLGKKDFTYEFNLEGSTHQLSMKDVKDYIKPLSYMND